MIDHLNIFPVLGRETSKEWVPLDLSIHNKVIYPDNGDFSFDVLSDYIDAALKGRKIGYGGYLEPRGMYLNDELFGGDRNIHLGIDIWAEAGTKLYAAEDGVLHSLANNNNALDYGNTLIITYDFIGLQLHCLYGHLSDASLVGKMSGMKISKGQEIATMGNHSENGGWKPHLHLQLIKEMEDRNGDFPGVCSKAELDIYKLNCPDPMILVKE